MAAVAAVVGLVMIGAVPGAVGAESPAAASAAKTEAPAPTGPPAELTAAQQAAVVAQIPMTQAANEIRNLVEAGAGEGFAGLQVSGGTLELWWKGKELPNDVQKVVDTARVSVRAAAYSKQELKAASAKLWASAGPKGSRAVHAIKLPFNGSGLTAAVPPGQAQAFTAAEATTAAGVPVAVVEQDQLKLESGRCDDSAPWYGGAALYNQSYSGGGPACEGFPGRIFHCSSAFGVRYGGIEYLLTAGHCGRPGDVFANTNHTATIGVARHEHVAHDLMLISTDAGNRIWDGSAGQQNFSKPISAWAWSYGGQHLCHSGAKTGTRCAHIVDATYTELCGLDIRGAQECYVDLISAGGGTSTEGGDSGGAWVAPADGSWSTLLAVGSHTGSYTFPWRRMVFQDFGTATRDFPGLAPILN